MNQSSIRDVSVAEARAMAAQGALLVDVREPQEWVAGHVEGSRLVPLAGLNARDLPRDRPIVLVCRSGNRSGVAARTLEAAGHPDVVNMTGGLTSWESAGFPLVSGASR